MNAPRPVRDGEAVTRRQFEALRDFVLSLVPRVSPGSDVIRNRGGTVRGAPKTLGSFPALITARDGERHSWVEQYWDRNSGQWRDGQLSGSDALELNGSSGLEPPFRAAMMLDPRSMEYFFQAEPCT